MAHICIDCFVIGEFHTERIIGAPQYTAFAGATMAARNAQHELIRDRAGQDAGDSRARILKIGENAGSHQMAFQVVDCRRRIPFDPEVPSPLVTHLAPRRLAVRPLQLGH